MNVNKSYSDRKHGWHHLAYQAVVSDIDHSETTRKRPSQECGANVAELVTHRNES